MGHFAIAFVNLQNVDIQHTTDLTRSTYLFNDTCNNDLNEKAFRYMIQFLNFDKLFHISVVTAIPF